MKVDNSRTYTIGPGRKRIHLSSRTTTGKRDVGQGKTGRSAGVSRCEDIPMRYEQRRPALQVQDIPLSSIRSSYRNIRNIIPSVTYETCRQFDCLFWGEDEGDGSRPCTVPLLSAHDKSNAGPDWGIQVELSREVMV